MRDRQRERQTDRKRVKDRERERDRHRWRQRERQTDGERDRQADRQTERQRHRERVWGFIQSSWANCIDCGIIRRAVSLMNIHESKNNPIIEMCLEELFVL